MKKEMLINVLQPEECRIAILEDGVLEELYVERTSQESYVGNIYKGRIVNIEPSIQAAFVDFGIGRNGFLHVSDVDPAYYRHLETPRGGRDRDDRRGSRDRDDRGSRGRGRRSGRSRAAKGAAPEAPAEGESPAEPRGRRRRGSRKSAGADTPPDEGEAKPRPMDSAERRTEPDDPAIGSLEGSPESSGE